MTSSPIGLEAVPESGEDQWRKREIGLAVRNAAKLGGSLAVTWGIGLVVRLYLPRFLGPEHFGMLSFAEAFSTTAFVLLEPPDPPLSAAPSAPAVLLSEYLRAHYPARRLRLPSSGRSLAVYDLAQPLAPR